MAKIRLQVDEIADNDGIVEVQGKVGYKTTPILGAMAGNELVCVDNLSGILGNAGSDKFYPAATALPIVMVNGVDFISTALRPIVNATVNKDSTTDTTNGSVFGYDYNFTDSDKDNLVSITILDNGFGSLEFDTWFRIV